MRPDARRATRASLQDTLLAAAALALMLLLPLVELWAANADHGLSRRALSGHFGWMLGYAAVVALVLRLLLFRLELWRVLVALVPVTFLFFAYGALTAALQSGTQFASGFPASQARSRILVLVAFTCLLAAVFWLGLRFLRTRQRLLGVLVVTALLLIAPAVRLLLAAESAPTGAASAAPATEPGAIPAALSPNIYWLIADGYPRADVIREEFGYDNSGFDAALEGRGFLVARSSVANYPLTFLSVASMASMDYVVDATTPSDQVRNIKRFTRMAGGDNQLVRGLRRLGYRYVHFTSGYEQSTLCSGIEDLCIVGSEDALDEIGLVLLRRTPLLDLGLAVMPVSARISRLTPFSWRGFDALQEHLAEIRAVRRPFMLYAHVIDPHPPLRHNADCSIRPSAPDLMGWAPEQRPAFVAEIQCVNVQLARVLDDILARDPQAIVILNGDHGSAFRNQFAKAPESWTRADVHERFSTLLALRVPAPCRAVAARVESLVNVFRAVMGCLTGTEIPLLPDRQFVTAYNDSPHFGKVVPVESLGAR